MAAATDGGALLNRKHVGRVKAVNPSEGRLVVEGMFHDQSFREIPVVLEPDAPIINPDLMDRTRAVTRREIQPGHYVVLECEETGGRHVARKVTITSTEEEEKIQRALFKARRGPRPRLRGTGGDPR
jgi:hypothetical protein